jgi:hypothetical protein
MKMLNVLSLRFFHSFFIWDERLIVAPGFPVALGGGIYPQPEKGNQDAH